MQDEFYMEEARKWGATFAIAVSVLLNFLLVLSLITERHNAKKETICIEAE